MGFLVLLLGQCNSPSSSSQKKVAGKPIDSLHGVVVYYNGDIDNTFGRNRAPDGYNLGLKYQCVEFVKRYYYQHYKHKMPDSYGHAKDFFDKNISDGKLNKKRGLIQYTNPSQSKPQTGDLVIFAPTLFNKYGHVAIISAVTGKKIEIIQQNAGTWGSSREKFALTQQNGKWKISHKNLLG